MLGIHVDHLAVVVTDPEHERYGHLARITDADHRDAGVFYLKFADGTEMSVPDGAQERHPTPVQSFFRRRGDAGRVYDVDRLGPAWMTITYLSAGGTLEQLDAEYQALFGEKFVPTSDHMP